MKTQNTTTGAGGISAAHFLAATNQAMPLGQERIVSHPDGAGFALLDVYGDFYRSHHGFVFKFVTKDLAGKMLGLFDENHPLI